ncbi:MAG: CDP-alcohol phosphatidyltransferase [Frankiales bacterium]|nr:CDP-alcohol phosphatidyltransferase [Frankiales bacterium]
MSEAAVVTERSFSEAYARLSAAQKSARRAGGYSRWVNRPVGRYLAAWAYVRGLSPNGVTMISGLFTFIAIPAIAVLRPHWYFVLLEALFLLIGYAFDSADGQLARLQGSGSAAGEWLDHVSDCIKCCGLHLAVLICWFRFYDLRHASYLLIPIAYTLVSTVWFFAIILSEQIRRYTVLRLGLSSTDARPTAAPVLQSLLALPADYGLLAVSMVLLGVHPLFGVVYTLLLVGNGLLLAMKLLAWYSELNRLGAPAAAGETSQKHG